MFLIKNDFYGVYLKERFNKLIENNDNIWRNVEPTVIEDVSSYLRARYDVSVIFRDVKVFNFTDTYNENQLVYLDAELYEEKEYSLNDLTIVSDLVYRNITAIAVGEPFDVNKWELLGFQYEKHITLQDNTTGQSLRDSNYFKIGDNRNKKLVEVFVDIMLYNILNRLNSIDIPVSRKERYDGNDGKQLGGAIGWLRRVAKGHIQPDFPLREQGQIDQTGNVVMYGDASEIKTKNMVF